MSIQIVINVILFFCRVHPDSYSSSVYSFINMCLSPDFISSKVTADASEDADKQKSD